MTPDFSLLPAEPLALPEASAAANTSALTEALRRFVDRIRPSAANMDDGFALLLNHLQREPGDCARLGRTIAALLRETRHVSLFADAGVLPPTGFAAELYRRVIHRVLPDVPNPLYLRDCTAEVLHHRRDDKWLAAATTEQWETLVSLLAPDHETTSHLLRELDNALDVLSLRLAGLGLEAELTRVHPEIEDHDSPFVSQQREIARWLELKSVADNEDAARHALVLLDQCREVLTKARRNTASIGTSFRLTYLMRRLDQTITRMELLIAARTSTGATRQHAIAMLVRELLLAKARRNDIREHVTQSMDLVALRVTENAGRTGEHYITETRSEYFSMFRAALGAGLVVAFMAWAKVAILNLHLPALLEVFGVCTMYALAFILIHLLHFSLATKQPAMTAAAIAGVLEDTKDERTAPRMERLVDMVARVTRSQFAAIMGNIILTLPVAMLLTWLVLGSTGAHIVGAEKAAKLVQDADVRTLAAWYAATAGVVLFLGGLISGYFDNKAVYSHIRARVAQHRGLHMLLGTRLSQRLGVYLENNLGALAGNAALGFMLGMVGPLGHALGLPLDVRHVTITTASVGLALPALLFDISVSSVVAMVVGIAAIGFFNLVVSFGLTLWLAFKARRVSLPERHQFLPLLWSRFRTAPRQFFLPPRT